MQGLHVYSIVPDDALLSTHVALCTFGKQIMAIDHCIDIHYCNTLYIYFTFRWIHKFDTVQSTSVQPYDVDLTLVWRYFKGMYLRNNFRYRTLLIFFLISPQKICCGTH